MKKFLSVLVVLGLLYIIYDVVWGGRFINRVYGTLFVKTDPCSLVTQQEVEAAMGVPVKKVKSGAFGKGKFCTYQTQQEPRWGLVVSAVEPGDEFFSQVKAIRQEAVTGIGDEAFYSMGSPPDLYVLVQKKNVCLQLDMEWEETARGSEEQWEVQRFALRVEKELAAKAVARLQK